MKYIPEFTEEKKEQILDELFEKNYATCEVVLHGDITATLKTLTALDYVELDPALSNVKGTKLLVVQTLALEKLSRSLVRYHKIKFNSSKEAKEHLQSIPVVILDKLVKALNEFEAEIQKLLTPETIENNFFEQPDSAKSSEL